MTQTLSAALLAIVTLLAEERRPGVSQDLAVADFALVRPKSRDHGDWASNAALKLAKNLGVSPHELAVEIADRLAETQGIASVEVAGPGFINVRLDAVSAGSLAKTIVEAGDAFGSNDSQRGRTINVEFVSANPTGPLHIGHTRWAALGDSIARLLIACGATVTREFYINDAGVQMEQFGRSVLAAAKGETTPEDGYGYAGTYIDDLGRRVLEAKPGLLGRFAHGVEVRLAHPLYGEVRRRRAPPTRLRRLRGLVAAQLAASEDRDDIRVVVRRAALSLDSDLKPDPDLLIRAAQAATWLADLPLADRLADAAIHAGSGPEANLIRGRALTWLSRGTEAEEVFAGIATNDLSDAERARVAFLRAGNMLWGLQDPVRAKEIIDDASNTTPPGSRGCIDAFLAVYWAAMGNPKAAIKAWANIVLDELPGIVGAEVPWAIGQAAGELGRTAEAAAVAEAGYAITSRFLDAAQMRFSIGDAHVTALLLSGQVEAASEQAQRLCEQAADMPGGVELLSRGVAGRAALAAGRLDTACSLLRPVVDVLFGSGQTGGFYPFGYRYKIPLTIALAIRGSNDDAEAAYATLDHHRFPSWQYVSWERALAQAWVAAAQGAVTEAITLATSAADKARAIGGFAVEAMCLQTATQFGHGSTAARLRELEAIVEGPRVRVAARFAEALHDGEGAQLAAVSDEFERMGDLVAATDAAAHAAIAYRRQDLRGSALGCSTRAEALAEQCGGVSTPALRQAAEPLPMTDREREIVMLIGQGLSNRAVADRLTLSVRTVEDHIYKAMTKTGTASRHELAALLRHHKPETQD